MVICGLCLMNIEEDNKFVHLESIVAMNNVEMSILEMIEFAINIKLKIDDNTYCICTNCIYKANLAYDFKLLCIEVEKKQLDEQQSEKEYGMQASIVECSTGSTSASDHSYSALNLTSTNENDTLQPSVLRSSNGTTKILIANEEFTLTSITDEATSTDGDDFDVEIQAETEVLDNEEEENRIMFETEEVICIENDMDAGQPEVEVANEEQVEKPSKICTICGKSFPKACRLKYHMNTHANERNFSCSFCSKSFNNAANVRLHIAAMHDATRVRKPRKKAQSHCCKHCDFTAANSQRLTAHLRMNHLADVQHECPICCLRFETAKKLEAHRAIHSPSYYSACALCGKVKGKKAMYIHLKYEHNGTPRSCDECGGKFFAHFKAYAAHMDAVHNKNAPRDFACDQCDKTFRYESKLKQHAAQHAADTGPYHCPHCAFSTTSRQGFKLHVHKGHTELHVHRCGACAYSTATYSELVRHAANVHDPNRRVFCERADCDFITHTKRLLGIHERRTHLHVGGGPKCPDCGKSYANVTTLRMHRESAHIGTHRKHTCATCGCTLANANVLRAHINRRHSNIRPYKCTQCGRAFASAGNRRQHEAIHGHACVKCQLCDEMFKTVAARSMHTKNVHAGINAHALYMHGKVTHQDDEEGSKDENDGVFKFIPVENEGEDMIDETATAQGANKLRLFE